jgi:hypothetical protein
MMRKALLLALSRLKTSAVMIAMIGTTGAIATPLWAQQAIETRGFQLNLGLTLGLETQSNRALDPAKPGSSTEARTGISIGLLRQTDNQRLSFDLGGELRNLNGPEDTKNGFNNPLAVFGYDRTSSASRLSLSASLRETDLADQGLVFDETSQEFIFADGTATRRSTSVSAQLNWRDDAPLGFGVLAKLAENEYRGGVATGIDGSGLGDTQRLTFGTTARLDLNEVSQLNIGLNYSKFKNVDLGDKRDTWTLTNALTIERPDGVFSLNLNVTDTEDGTRVATSVGRTLEYPLGSLSGNIGATNGVTGKIFLTGRVNVSHALPRGNLSFGIARAVASSTLQDTEQISSSLTIGYLHELNILSSISLDANWAKLSRTIADTDTTSGIISATYSRELTPDWNMNFGIRHRLTDEDATGTVRSNSLFLNLQRNFVTRF